MSERVKKVACASCFREALEADTVDWARRSDGAGVCPKCPTPLGWCKTHRAFHVKCPPPAEVR